MRSKIVLVINPGSHFLGDIVSYDFLQKLFKFLNLALVILHILIKKDVSFGKAWIFCKNSGEKLEKGMA